MRCTRPCCERRNVGPNGLCAEHHADEMLNLLEEVDNDPCAELWALLRTEHEWLVQKIERRYGTGALVAPERVPCPVDRNEVARAIKVLEVHEELHRFHGMGGR